MNTRSRRPQGTKVRLPITPRQMMYGLGGVLVAFALVFAIKALASRGEPADTTLAGPGEQGAIAPAASPDALPDVTPEPSIEPGPTPEPTAKVKLLPVISRKKNAGKRIAITVDDCFQTANVRKIIGLAEEYGIKLTFFPKGSEIKKNVELWQEIYQKGFEIENHSYGHEDVAKLKDKKLLGTVTKHENALNRALGVNYHMSYFRCPGGSGEKDPRLHAILRERGYKGVAHWSLSGTRKASETIRMAQDGDIILFHSLEKDVNRLKKVIPALLEKGYELVTVNELYGNEPNQTTPLEDAG